MKCLYVYECSERYVLLRGPALLTWLNAREIPAVRSNPQRGWKCRRDRLPDVLAMAREDAVKVHLKGYPK